MVNVSFKIFYFITFCFFKILKSFSLNEAHLLFIGQLLHKGSDGLHIKDPNSIKACA